MSEGTDHRETGGRGSTIGNPVAVDFLVALVTGLS